MKPTQLTISHEAPETRHKPPRIYATLLLLIVCVLVTTKVTYAQDTVTGAFEGTVTDSQGTLLNGADVEITNQQTGLTINLHTDNRGRFYQGLLLPGVYKIRVTLAGYQTHEHLQLLKITYTGEVVPVPVSLEPAAPGTPAVTTTATSPPTPAPGVEDTDIPAGINRLDGRRSGSFSEEEVLTLPLSPHSSRSFDDFALIAIGVAPPPQTLGSVAGPGVGAGVGS